MSGEWARACDERDRAVPDQWSEYAAYQLGRAIWMHAPGESVAQADVCRISVETAGACIRAWRKSLPVQGERTQDFRNIRTGRLLWAALGDVYRAQLWHSRDPAVAANNLRNAESLLRTWWKRQEAVQELDAHEATPCGG